MKNLKQKVVTKEKAVRAKAPDTRKKNKSQSEGDLVQLWQEELRVLTETKFQSRDQFLAALIERVVVRLKIPQAAGAQTKKFLKELFETDPALMEELGAMYSK